MVCLCTIVLLLVTTTVWCVKVDLIRVLSTLSINSTNVTVRIENLGVDRGIVTFDRLVVEEETKKEKPTEAKVYNLPDLAASLNHSVNPCDDFYSFVCDNWIATNEIRDADTSIGHMSILTNLVGHQLDNLLSIPHKEEKSHHHLARLFYRKCREHKNSTDNSAFPILLEKLKALEHSSDGLNDWLIQFRPLTFLYDVTVTSSEINSSLNILQIGPTGAVLGNQAYSKKEYHFEYASMRNFLVELLGLLQEDDVNNEVFSSDSHKFVDRIESFFKVDRIISKLSEDYQYNKSTSYVAFKDLDMFFPNANWDKYFSTFVPAEKMQVLRKSIVQVTDLDVIQELEDIVCKMDQKMLHHYLEWQTIIYFGEFLDDRYQQVMQNFNFAVSGVTAVDKKADCLDTTTNVFVDIVSQMYVEDYSNTTGGQLEQMVNNVIESFDEMLDENSWMDEATRAKAKEKLAAINKFLGFNKSVMNRTMLEERYKNLTFLDSDSYYQMVTKLQQWSQAVLLMRLNTTRDNQHFEFPASQVNAFYDPTTNSIALTAAILQAPYFSESRPIALNYGAIGSAIGHEITHGFDSIGSEFDKNGNRHKWWDEETLRTFTDRTKCIVTQYDKFRVEKTNQTIDGRLTKNENIADNGGLRAAIKALAKLKNPPKEVIKGMEQFTANQLFFISNAYAWCGKSRPQQVLAQLYSDSHSPEKARINIVMGNQPEFSEAFNCPLGSPMNPVDKCSVW